MSPDRPDPALPLDDGERRSTRRLRLTRSGVLKPGLGKLPAALKRAPKGSPEASGVLAALLAVRRGDSAGRS
jgi:hypothetical protein